MDILLVAERRGERRVLPLPQGIITLGRSRHCTIRIPVVSVSRMHCRLYETDAGFVMVEDLHSSNGSRLNGERFTGAVVARPGDRLKIGPITFVVEYELTPAAVESLRMDRAAPLQPPHGRDERVETKS
jgi:ABC transport system ATP-binding/permease protein